MKTSLKTYPSCKDCENLESNLREKVGLKLKNEGDNSCALNLPRCENVCPKDKWIQDFEAELRKILKQNYNYKDYWKTIIKEILGENK